MLMTKPYFKEHVASANGFLCLKSLLHDEFCVMSCDHKAIREVTAFLCTTT